MPLIELALFHAAGIDIDRSCAVLTHYAACGRVRASDEWRRMILMSICTTIARISNEPMAKLCSQYGAPRLAAPPTRNRNVRRPMKMPKTLPRPPSRATPPIRQAVTTDRTNVSKPRGVALPRRTHDKAPPSPARAPETAKAMTSGLIVDTPAALASALPPPIA